jgi:hypothetical protein
MTPTNTWAADQAERATICRYLSTRTLARAAAEAQKRAEAARRLELALSLQVH